MRWGWWPHGLSVPFPSVGLHEERECFRPLLGLVHRLGHQSSAQHGTSRACPSPCPGLSVNKCGGHIHAHGLVCELWIILILTAMLHSLLIRNLQALKLESFSQQWPEASFSVFWEKGHCELKPELTPSRSLFPYWILTVFTTTLICHITLIIFYFNMIGCKKKPHMTLLTGYRNVFVVLFDLLLCMWKEAAIIKQINLAF